MGGPILYMHLYYSSRSIWLLCDTVVMSLYNHYQGSIDLLMFRMGFILMLLPMRLINNLSLLLPFTVQYLYLSVTGM